MQLPVETGVGVGREMKLLSFLSDPGTEHAITKQLGVLVSAFVIDRQSVK